MNITEFEQRVLDQRPVGSGHYDAEYFTGDWRDAGNNYNLETRRQIEAKNPALIKEVFQPKKEIEVVPNFIDPDRFSPESPQLSCRFVHAGRKVLMHVSNFRPVKRVLDVVEVFACLTRRVPSSLVMVGDGPDRPAAEALCREKGLSAHVSFLGNMPALEAVMPSADLYLLTSDAESFGLSALEAQACGVPVLGYAAGGLPEVVVNGETGFLRSVGDVAGLAEDGVELLLDAVRYRTMAAAAQERAVRLFNADAIVRRYLDLYERVLAR